MYSIVQVATFTLSELHNIANMIKKLATIERWGQNLKYEHEITFPTSNRPFHNCRPN